MCPSCYEHNPRWNPVNGMPSPVRLQVSSEKSMSDLENKLRLSFDLGRRELSYEWEVKMQRLRTELDHRHESEKQAAVNAAREQSGRETAAAKIAMEKTLANCAKEVHGDSYQVTRFLQLSSSKPKIWECQQFVC